ncbi:MAG TPA: rhodanese-like domain-containing protein [Gemmatimonadaceae bacterium]|nr:rhodanese-like domain-containing protein [Gemmatimonadaceae bacterium]
MTEPGEAERVADALTRIEEVTPGAAIAARAGGAVTFVDVREPAEWNLFRIPGAVHCPIGALAAQAAATVPADRDLVTYCSSGSRSALAADQLRAMGYARVRSLRGGVRAWMDAGGELED